MYLNHFHLAEPPFSIAPNPRYLYLSQRHQEALAHLLYGVHGDGGFVLLTGAVGAGKTTVCRRLLEQIPDSCDVAYIFNPRLSVAELLATICTEFGIECLAGNASIKVFVDCINAYLLDAHARGRHTVLIIDEAQNLSADVLEQMRLLTNLETDQRKLLQIILLGQSELTDMLARPELRQLAQRIIARYHLDPLSRKEVAAYVQHRLDVAGAQRQLFPARLMRRLYRLSGGVPRLINVICDRALLGAYTQGKEQVDAATLEQAAREVLQPGARRWFARPPLMVAVGAAVALVGLSLALLPALRPSASQSHAPAGEAVAASAGAAAPAVRPAAAGDSVVRWPASQASARERSQPLAYASLFKAWGAEYRGADPCVQAVELGLTCRIGLGGAAALEELRQANRPAVLVLRDEQGRELHATLLTLDASNASLVMGGETRAVTLAALAAQWSGRYTLLSRQPPAYREKIRVGKRGPVVEWVARQMAVLHGQPAPVIPAGFAFDAALEQQVRQFQREQGLKADGRPGAQTLQRLSSVADRAAPQLQRATGGR